MPKGKHKKIVYTVSMLFYVIKRKTSENCQESPKTAALKGDAHKQDTV